MKYQSETVTVLCSVSLLVLGTISLNAQSVNSVSSSIEPLVKNKKAGWVLEWKEVKNRVAHLHWSIDKKQVDVSITETNSAAEATELFTQTALKVTVPPKAKLGEYGDEALLYKSDGSNRSMILIRQDTLFILVTASHLEYAKEFATDISRTAKAKKAGK
jgi:hypothetical protein